MDLLCIVTCFTQGDDLSPLLASIMLGELNKELGSGGHKYVRYADDCLILCKSRKSAERTMENIVPFITGELFLKASLQKTTVNHVSKIKYLGYGLYRHKGKCHMKIHPKSVARIKSRIRELTTGENKWGNQEREEKLRGYAGGRINYYRYADMKSLMEQADEWLRHRIRGVYWERWKKVRTRYKVLRALHLPEWKMHEMANCREGVWGAAGILNSALAERIIVDRPGYPDMAAHYLKVRVNY